MVTYRRKDTSELEVERLAEQAYARGLERLVQTDAVKAALKESRRRATLIGNELQKRRREGQS
jgi:hypothetical protein